MRDESARKIYENEFEERLFTLRPASILDIGCGEGDFLRRASARGIAACGVDSNPDRIAKTRDAGLNSYCAPSHALPFTDRQFEAAVCERSVHHFADLAASLREALRVARDLYIFDPWYDETIPSQKCAADLERWMKRVDTAKGRINRGPFSAHDILQALPIEIGTVDVSVAYRLNLMPASIDEFRTFFESLLSDWNGAEPYRDELEILLANAQRVGLSEMGAMMLFVRRAK